MPVASGDKMAIVVAIAAVGIALGSDCQQLSISSCRGNASNSHLSSSNGNRSSSSRGSRIANTSNRRQEYVDVVPSNITYFGSIRSGSSSNRAAVIVIVGIVGACL